MIKHMSARKKYDWHIIRGKNVKQWARHFGVTIMAIYKWIEYGTLEARIDGTHIPKIPRRFFGLTTSELKKRFGVSGATILRWSRDGTLERRIQGEMIPRKSVPTTKLIDDMDYKELAMKLGNGKPISRQRVFQLKKKGQLRDRLDGVDLKKKGFERLKERTRVKYESSLAQRKPGESLRQLSNRTGVSYSLLWQRARGKVPFAKERKLFLAKQKVEMYQKRVDKLEAELKELSEKDDLKGHYVQRHQEVQ